MGRRNRQIHVNMSVMPRPDSTSAAGGRDAVADYATDPDHLQTASQMEFGCLTSALSQHLMTLAQSRLIKSPRAASLAMRQFFWIADHWSLTRHERRSILSVSDSTLRRYKAGHFKRGLRLPVLVRVSLVFNIYEATRNLMASSERAHEWMHLPNSARGFDGRSALDLMSSGLDGIALVWRHLSAQIVE